MPKPKVKRSQNGGFARAAKLSPERRREISAKAGQAFAAKRYSSPEFIAKAQAQIAKLQAKLPPQSQGAAVDDPQVEGARA